MIRFLNENDITDRDLELENMSNPPSYKVVGYTPEGTEIWTGTKPDTWKDERSYYYDPERDKFYNRGYYSDGNTFRHYPENQLPFPESAKSMEGPIYYARDNGGNPFLTDDNKWVIGSTQEEATRNLDRHLLDNSLDSYLRAVNKNGKIPGTGGVNLGDLAKITSNFPIMAEDLWDYAKTEVPNIVEDAKELGSIVVDSTNPVNYWDVGGFWNTPVGRLLTMDPKSHLGSVVYDPLGYMITGLQGEEGFRKIANQNVDVFRDLNINPESALAASIIAAIVTKNPKQLREATRMSRKQAKKVLKNGDDFLYDLGKAQRNMNRAWHELGGKGMTWDDIVNYETKGVYTNNVKSLKETIEKVADDLQVTPEDLFDDLKKYGSKQNIPATMQHTPWYNTVFKYLDTPWFKYPATAAFGASIPWWFSGGYGGFSGGSNDVPDTVSIDSGGGASIDTVGLTPDLKDALDSYSQAGGDLNTLQTTSPPNTNKQSTSIPSSVTPQNTPSKKKTTTPTDNTKKDTPSKKETPKKETSKKNDTKVSEDTNDPDLSFLQDY